VLSVKCYKKVIKNNTLDVELVTKQNLLKV